MTRSVEWLETPKSHVGDPITFGQMFEPETGLEKKVEEEEKQIQQVRTGLSTTEKVVIASLFLQVLSFAWGVFQFRSRQEKAA